MSSSKGKKSYAVKAVKVEKEMKDLMKLHKRTSIKQEYQWIKKYWLVKQLN